MLKETLNLLLTLHNISFGRNTNYRLIAKPLTLPVSHLIVHPFIHCCYADSTAYLVVTDIRRHFICCHEKDSNRYQK